MHVTPDMHAVHVLGQASGKVKTLCGDVVVEWQHVPGQHFAMTPRFHTIVAERDVLHVPAPMGVPGSLQPLASWESLAWATTWSIPQ